MKAGPIWNNDDAQAECPTVCTNAGDGTWNGQWRPPSPARCRSAVHLPGQRIRPFRHRYLEFTGEYVLHCHFLGHEDRGMMFNVQTVCPSTPQWGTTVPAGTADNCQPQPAGLPAVPELRTALLRS